MRVTILFTPLLATTKQDGNLTLWQQLRLTTPAPRLAGC